MFFCRGTAITANFILDNRNFSKKNEMWTEANIL